MKLSRILFGATVAVAASAMPASAQQQTYNFSDVSGQGSCGYTSAGGTNGLGNVWSCAAQGSNTTSLRITAFGVASGNGNAFGNAAVINHGSSFGLGVGNAAEGGINASSGDANHAVDNLGSFDMLLLDFIGGPVDLDHVTLGWTGADADFQILRLVGANASINGLTPAQLVSNGWTRTDAIDNATSGTSTDQGFNVNAGNSASRYWLVSAYNPAFGGAGDLNRMTCGRRSNENCEDYDQFKVLSVKATSVVPEPSTYALMGAGLLGIFGVARRRRQA